MNHSEGFTRDISADGVFIATSDLLPVGSIVQMEVRLSPMQVKLRTQGRVVRTEAEGFGAVADMGFRMQFHDVAGRRVSSKMDCEEQLEAAPLPN